jgi:hypothetical protein
MRANRVFLPQETVDVWLADGRASLEGEQLQLLPEGPALRLTSAVHIKTEVAGGGDAPALCGKVKSVDEIAALSGEVAGGSVILGDNAYEVVEGFLADLESTMDGSVALGQLMRACAGG